MNPLESLGYIVDTPGALLRGVLAGKPGSRGTGREALHLGPNKPGFDAGDVPGFLAEVLLDPLNLVGGAAAAKGLRMVVRAMKGKQSAKAAGVVNKMRQSVAPVASKPKPLAVAFSDAPGPNRWWEKPAKGAVPSATREEGFIREGVKDVGEHYARKMQESGHATGQVMNPHSLIPLFDDPIEGGTRIQKARKGELLIAQKDMPPDEVIHFQPADRWFHPKRRKVEPTLAEHVGYNAGKVADRPGEVLRKFGVHEGTHFITWGDRNLHRRLKAYINRLSEIRERVDWRRIHKHEKQPRFAKRYARFRNDREEFDYLTSPAEVMGRVATTRVMLEQMPPRKAARYLNNPTLLRTVSNDTDDLLRAYDHRLVKILLKTMPVAAPVAAIPAAVAMNRSGASNQPAA